MTHEQRRPKRVDQIYTVYLVVNASSIILCLYSPILSVYVHIYLLTKTVFWTLLN